MSDPFGFDALDRAWLAAKPGVKWQRTPGAVAAWVADMDMPTAPIIRERLHELVDGADFGYPNWRTWHGSPLGPLFAERAARRYGWQIPSERELHEFCDVVQAVQAVLHVCTEPGDGVVVHTPAYPPFFSSISEAGCRLVELPARGTGSGVAFDLDELDRRLAVEPARVLLLCHPHNPTGHVFDRAELTALAELAERHDLLVLSDEIHADLTYPPATHLPIAALAPEVAARTITVHSASKAFNLAGLRYAVAHLGPAWVRERFRALPGHLFGAMNLFAVEATRAAWTEGDDWLAAVVAHLARNRDRLTGLLATHLPSVGYSPPSATYLAWLDCRTLGLGDDPSEHFRSRGIDLSPGPDFGAAGAGHVRLNFATSGAVLADMVAMMGAAVAG